MKFIVSLGLAIAIFWTVSPQVARAQTAESIFNMPMKVVFAMDVQMEHICMSIIR